MKVKKLVSSLLFVGLAGAALSSHAEGWNLSQSLPRGASTFAITGGALDTNAANEDAIGIYGLEYSAGGGFMQGVNNHFRTHIQLNHSDESGVRATSLEFQPRYTVPLGGGFSAGIGPTLAWVNAKTTGDDKNLFGYGVASGVEYRTGPYMGGVDLRYLNTTRRDDFKLEGWVLALKLGLNF